MILYKYCHKHGVQNLRSLELKVTRLDQFNDPFEFLPATPPAVPTRTIKRFARDKEVQRRMYAQMQAKGYAGSFKQYRKRVLATRAEDIQRVAANPEIPKRIRANLLDYTYRSVGVLSLSAVPDSILMWSHYADFHRGIMLAIDTDLLPPVWLNHLVKVEYRTDRVVMDMKWLPQSHGHKEFIRRMMRTKSCAWEYEQEYRLLFKLNGLTQRPLDDGSPGFFVKIPPPAIREVFVGCKCPTAIEHKIRETLSAAQLKHVTLKRSAVHDTEFRLTFNPVAS